MIDYTYTSICPVCNFAYLGCTCRTTIGIKHDEKKLRIDLISSEAIEELGKVLTYGCEKYGDRNWEKGIKFSRVYAAILRHLVLGWWQGKDNDEESGINHLSHALTGLMFLITYVKRGMKEWDDRPNRSNT